jgi:hypothetical protein
MAVASGRPNLCRELGWAGAGGKPQQLRDRWSGWRCAATSSSIGSCRCWRAVRITLSATCWVCAPFRLRFPPQLLRLTSAGRSACSAHQLRQMRAHRRGFKEARVFLPISPANVIETCLYRLRTIGALEGAGFSVPPYRSMRSPDDLEDFDRLPAVLERSIGGGGSAHLYLGQERAELHAYAGLLLAAYDEFLVQAYVGTVDQEYPVGVLVDMDGVLLTRSQCVAISRLHSATGSASATERSAPSFVRCWHLQRCLPESVTSRRNAGSVHRSRSLWAHAEPSASSAA